MGPRGRDTGEREGGNRGAVRAQRGTGMQARERAIRLLVTSAALALAVLVSAPARAGDLYASGGLSISSVTGSSDGRTDFNFSPRGSDDDSSPVYGGAVGFEVALDEPVPSIGDWTVPDWRLRTELEALGGRDYDLRTKGGDGFFSNTTSWSLMQNFYLDVPMYAPLTALLGRVPILEPLSFYVGGGIGLISNTLKATDNVSRGKKTLYEMTWQGSAGFSYALTDLVSFSLGYRYVDLGQPAVNLRTDAAQPPIGRFKLDLAAHELTTGLRVRFYGVRVPSVAPR